jgi:hypothetical protein
MTCEEFVELVTAYLEGTLPAEDRVAFDLLGELPEESLSSPGRERLLDAFAQRRRTPDPDAT